jgi:hypothetical protein
MSVEGLVTLPTRAASPNIRQALAVALRVGSPASGDTAAEPHSSLATKLVARLSAASRARRAVAIERAMRKGLASIN